MTKASELIKEITSLIEQEGYTVFGNIISDYGITVKLWVIKDGEKSILVLREAFYDTDAKGNRTKVHGVLDIRQTPWYQNKRAG